MCTVEHKMLDCCFDQHNEINQLHKCKNYVMHKLRICKDQINL